MNGIIVVFPKIEDGKSVRNLLVRYGYEVTAVCTQGAQVLNYIDTMNDGIIISGYRFPDMYYFDLKHSLTPGFDMLLMASQRVCGECMDHEIVCVTMPLKVQDLISTVESGAQKEKAPFQAKTAYRRRKENFMGSQGSADGTKSYD